MKGKIFIPLLCVLALGLSACTRSVEPPPEPEHIQLGPNEFRLAELPELEPFAAYTEQSSRFYEEYQWHLVPGEDYGRLFPYAGKVLLDEEMHFTDTSYGLCTAAGEIVVDPVYNNVSVYEDGDMALLALSRKTGEYVTNGAFMEYESSMLSLAAIDGSWQTEEINGYVLGWDKDYVVLATRLQYREENGEITPDEAGQDLFVYDTQGRLLRQFEAVEPIDYYQGTLSLREQGGRYRVEDVRGNVLLEQEQYLSPFYGKYAIAQLPDLSYVLMDREGKYDPARSYDFVYFDQWDETFQFCLGDDYGGLDLEGNPIAGAEQDGEFLTDEYNGHRIRIDRDWEADSYAVHDLDSGESLQKVGSNIWFGYLANGWCFCTIYDPEKYSSSLEFYRLGAGEEPVYSMAGEGASLLSENVASISVSEPVSRVDAEGNEYSSTEPRYVLLFDLETGEEIKRIPGSPCWDVKGLGQVISSPNDYIKGALYDAAGDTILDTECYQVLEAGDGCWTVSGTPYSGLIDQDGQWILRLCTVSTD